MIDPDPCNCPECNGNLTMIQMKVGEWTCKECGASRKWSDTR